MKSKRVILNEALQDFISHGLSEGEILEDIIDELEEIVKAKVNEVFDKDPIPTTYLP